MYTLTKLENGFTVKFSASYDGIDLVCLEVKRFLAENGLEKLDFDVVLGVREVLTNAVRHGSKMDSSKNVFFSIEADEECLLIKAEYVILVVC